MNKIMKWREKKDTISSSPVISNLTWTQVDKSI